MSRTHANKIIAAAFILLLLIGNSATFRAGADSRQEQLEKEKNQAQQALDEINEQIKQNQDRLEQAEDQKRALQTQARLIVEQIGILVEQIAITEGQIEEMNRAIRSKQAEIDRRWAGFKARIAAMQEINDRGGIAILSQATNLYELLTFSQTLQDISEKDHQVLAEMAAMRRELETQRQTMEAHKAQLAGQQEQLAQKQQELTDSIRLADQAISEDEAELEAARQAEAEAVKKLEAAAAALDAYIRQQNNSVGNIVFDSSLGFVSPLPSYKYVTTQFGENGHGGVDWAALGGTPIYAAADGVVSIATFDPSYGNYVSIYHGTDNSGRNFATLYAHMQSAPAVQAGQPVKRGDLLGYVGNTGYSFGNHLHLELRINGNRTSPEQYIPRPSVVKRS